MSHHSFQPGAIWRDNNGKHINAHGGGMLVHDGVTYWFGEHKTEGDAGNRANVGVGVYSSTDLYNWTDRGVALAVHDDATSDIARGCILERPKVVFCRATGKFVMWFHLEPSGMGYLGARSGVAIADSPVGPYRFVRSFRPNAGYWPQNVPDAARRTLSDAELAQLKSIPMRGGPVPGFPTESLYRRDFAGGQMARDMNLFVDHDGQAYHLHASEENGTLHISRLCDDFLDSSGTFVRAFPGRFHEAPAPFRHNGRYFLFSSGCTGWEPNPARLSTADSIIGPWTELGNPCRGDAAAIETTFQSQSTFVLPVPDKPGAFIFMADRWTPKNAIDGRYIWLPVQFDARGIPFLEWMDEWDLSFFDRRA